MTTNIGWLQMHDKIYGIDKKMINAAEWAFILFDELMPCAGLDPTIATNFNTKLKTINGVYNLYNCHISFLTDQAVSPNHHFHVVFVVYNNSKVANLAKKDVNADRWVKIDTSNDQQFRLVFQFDKKFKFLRVGMFDKGTPPVGKGSDVPTGCEPFKAAAVGIAGRMASLHGVT